MPRESGEELEREKRVEMLLTLLEHIWVAPLMTKYLFICSVIHICINRVARDSRHVHSDFPRKFRRPAAARQRAPASNWQSPAATYRTYRTHIGILPATLPHALEMCESSLLATHLIIRAREMPPFLFFFKDLIATLS